MGEKPCKWKVESSMDVDQGRKVEIHYVCTNHDPPHRRFETKNKNR